MIFTDNFSFSTKIGFFFSYALLFSFLMFFPVEKAFSQNNQTVPLIISDFISIGPEGGREGLSENSAKLLRNNFKKEHSEKLKVLKPENIDSIEEAREQTTFNPGKIIVDIYNKYKSPFIMLGFYQLQPTKDTTNNAMQYFGTLTLYDAQKGHIIEQIHIEQTARGGKFQPDLLADAYYKNFDIDNFFKEIENHPFITENKTEEKEKNGFWNKIWLWVWPFQKETPEENKINTVELEDLPETTTIQPQPETETERDLLHKPLFSKSPPAVPESNNEKTSTDDTIYERTIDPLQIEAEPKISAVIEKILNGDYEEALEKVKEIEADVQTHPAFKNLILQLRQLIIVETKNEDDDF